MCLSWCWNSCDFHALWILIPGYYLSQCSTEDKCRLDERRRAVEQGEYDQMVHDVTKNERRSREATQLLPTTRLQFSQGIHVCVTIGLGFILGTAVGKGISLFGPSTVCIDTSSQIFRFPLFGHKKSSAAK